jgi:hypothetical protein
MLESTGACRHPGSKPDLRVQAQRMIASAGTPWTSRFRAPVCGPARTRSGTKAASSSWSLRSRCRARNNAVHESWRQYVSIHAASEGGRSSRGQSGTDLVDSRDHEDRSRGTGAQRARDGDQRVCRVRRGRLGGARHGVAGGAVWSSSAAVSPRLLRRRFSRTTRRDDSEKRGTSSSSTCFVSVPYTKK